MGTQTMERLTDWSARRSGGRITITARDDTGAEVKVSNVDTIAPRGGQIIATDKYGEEFVLAIQ